MSKTRKKLYYGLSFSYGDLKVLSVKLEIGGATMMKNFDIKNGGMYFLVFLGINFIFQKALPFVYSFVLSNISGVENIFVRNGVSYILYVLALVLSIILSTRTLRGYMNLVHVKAVVGAATLFYSLYLLLFQIQTLFLDIVGSVREFDEVFYLQGFFIVLNVLIFYFVSLKYLAKQANGRK